MPTKQELYIKFLEAQIKSKAKPKTKSKAKPKTKSKAKPKTKSKAKVIAKSKAKVISKGNSIDNFFQGIDQKGEKLNKNIIKIENKLKNVSLKKGISNYKRGRQQEEITRLKDQIATKKAKRIEDKEFAALKKEAELLKAEDLKMEQLAKESKLADIKRKKEIKLLNNDEPKIKKFSSSIFKKFRR